MSENTHVTDLVSGSVATFPDLIGILQWRGSSTLEEQLWTLHRDLLVERFEAAQMAHAAGGILAGIFSELPQLNRDRLLTAPETVSRLLTGARNIKFLLSSLLAEARLVGDTRPLATGSWTATGDWYFPPGSASVAAMESCFEWSEDRLFTAPRLAGTIPVDTLSPYSHGPAVALDMPCAPFSPDELRKLIPVLDGCMRKIARVSGACGTLMGRFLRSILLRKVSGSRNRIGSLSVDTFIGRMTLLLRDDHDDEERLADSFVHETIHALLYVFEHQMPFAPRGLGREWGSVRSPWSGRTLEAHAFSHAILVWFGLWQFWRRALTRQVFVEDRVRDHLETARRGFEAPGLADALREAEPLLSPEYISGARLLLDEVHRGSFE
jgi:hypothetical protein